MKRADFGIYAVGLIIVLLIAGTIILISQSNTLRDTQDDLDVARTSGTELAGNLSGQSTSAAVAATQAVNDQVAAIQNAMATAAAEQTAALQMAEATAEAEMTEALDTAATNQADALAQAETESAATAAAVSLQQAQVVASQNAEFAQSQTRSAESALATAGALNDARQTAVAQQTAAAQQALTAQAESFTEGRNEAFTIASGTSSAAFATYDSQISVTIVAFSNEVATGQASIDDLEGQVNQLSDDNDDLAATIEAQDELLEQGASNPTDQPDQPQNTGDQPVADVRVGDLIYEEPFDNNDNWYTGTTQGGETDIDGEYVLTIDEPDGSVYVYSGPEIEDAYLEVEVNLEDCEADTIFSITLRVSDDSTQTYAFVLTCDLSQWAILLNQSSGTDLLNSGATFGLGGDRTTVVVGALAQGNSLRLYVDGIIIGDADDSTLDGGFIGFLVGSPGGNSTIRLDNLRVWEAVRSSSS